MNVSWTALFRRPFRVGFLVALVLLGVGCGSKPASATTSSPAEAAAAASPKATNPPVATYREPIADDGPVLHLSYAQPKLPTVRLRIGANEMDAEVCRTIPQVATGLMFRPGIGPEDGMLFLFNRPHQTAFYMKNVDFDIDAAYIGPDGVILEIVRLKAQDRTSVPAKTDQVQFVLETAPDYFSKRNLGPGTLIMTDRGPLKVLLVGQ